MSDDELKQEIDKLKEQEREISYQRRILHGKIDILRAELVARLQKTGGKGVLESVDVESLTAILAGKATPPDQELKDLIQQLTEEEIEISYRRRILHGKIDILRAELVNRLRRKHEGGEEVISGADVQRLTDILTGKAMGETG